MRIGRYRIRINKLIFEKRILEATVILTVMFFGQMIYFPETLITTYKAELRNEILKGNKSAIEYYNERYLKLGIKLWED